jgi:hypothetical protein
MSDIDDDEPLELGDTDKIDLVRTVTINSASIPFTKEQATVSSVLANVSELLFNFFKKNSITKRILTEFFGKENVVIDYGSKGKRYEYTSLIRDLDVLTKVLSDSARMKLNDNDQKIFNISFELLIFIYEKMPNLQTEVFNLINTICCNFIAKGLADALQFLSCWNYAKQVFDRYTNDDQLILEAIFGQSSDQPAATVACSILPYAISNRKGGTGPDFTFLLIKKAPIYFLSTKYVLITQKMTDCYNNLILDPNLKDFFEEYNVLDGKNNINIDNTVMNMLTSVEIIKKELQKNLLLLDIPANLILSYTDAELVSKLEQIMKPEFKTILPEQKINISGKIEEFKKLKYCITQFRNQIFSGDTDYKQLSMLKSPEKAIPKFENLKIPKVRVLLFIQKKCDAYTKKKTRRLL